MVSDESFTRVAMTAGRLFLARGYAAVSLRAIAEALGIRAASLYFHCPAGKAELYARSLEVFLGAYRGELALARGRARFPGAVYRMADWMLARPPVDLQRIVRVDLPQLDEARGRAVLEVLHDAVLGPFVEVFEAATAASALRRGVDAHIAAASVIALVDGLGWSHLPPGREATEEELAAAKRTVRAGLRLVVDGARR
jgi:AcrR family transcriptional regulator